jgi:hypothetical protein
MKRTLEIISAAFLLAVVVWLLNSCATPQQAAAYDDLMATWSRVTADGVITPEERAELDAKSAVYNDELVGTDWAELLLTGGTTLLLSLFGVNAYRNRGLPGTTRKA